MADWEEVIQVVDRLQQEFQDLAVRGLRAVGPQHLGPLEAMREEFQRINAEHLAGRIEEVIRAIRNDDPRAAAALLRAQASLRLFERMLTAEVAAATLQQMLSADDASDEVDSNGEGEA